MHTSEAVTTLTQLDALAARELFQSGELAPSELMAATLSRIAECNGDRTSGVNAFSEVLSEEAQAAARDADAAWAAARPAGAG